MASRASSRWSVLLVSLAVMGAVLVAGLPLGTAGAATPAGSAGTGGPACTFNGRSLPLVTGVTEGGTVQVACTGLPPLHPYLVMETSLLLAIDPQTASLLSGTLSPGTLLSLLAGLPMINPSALHVVWSNLWGNLDVGYRTPDSQPLDRHATCPPSTEEINSGLIGCGLALVDLTSVKEVPAGSALLEYQGDPFLPPNPTLALTPTRVPRGGTVAASDLPGATTYWWLATLAELEGDLGGSPPPPPTISVALSGVTAPVADTVTVAPATYDGHTLTPPKISGDVTIPSKGVKLGPHTVTVTYTASLEGLPLPISASAPITVVKG